MFICKYCGKEFEKKQQLAGHIIWCKENPNRSGKCNFNNNKNSNFNKLTDNLFCKYCGKQCKNKNSLAQHEIRCKENPNKIKTIATNNFKKYTEDVKAGKREKKFTNQYTKAKELGLPAPVISEETRKKLGKGGRNQVWDDARRKKHSESMKRTVKNNPDSYSCSCVNGRTPRINYNGILLNGKWELDVAKFLDANKIIWERPNKPFEYEWENKIHLYFPDFYLPDYDMYIEVKGYERERDRCKWKVVPNLLVLKKKEIEQIRNNVYEFLF